MQHQQIALMPIDTPRKEGHIRFVCISDTHCRTKALKIPEGDVLIHAGDFTNIGKPEEIQGFSEFLGSLPHPHKVVIAGNHDLTFDLENYPKIWRMFNDRPFTKEMTKDQLKNCIYLEDSEVTVLGYKIYGSPWSARFYDWGFNVDRGEPSLKLWRKIPDNTDILITHGPPYGHGDLCKTGERAGCVDLLNEVQNRIKPLYHIFGHIHEGYGITTDGHTQFVNASICTIRYRPDNPPIIFDLPVRNTM